MHLASVLPRPQAGVFLFERGGHWTSGSSPTVLGRGLMKIAWKGCMTGSILAIGGLLLLGVTIHRHLQWTKMGNIMYSYIYYYITFINIFIPTATSIFGKISVHTDKLQFNIQYHFGEKREGKGRTKARRRDILSHFNFENLPHFYLTFLFRWYL